MKSFILENASAADLPAIGELKVVAYREFSEYLTPEAWEMMSSNLSKPERLTDRATFMVVKIDGAIAASVAYCLAGKSVDPIPTEWASILLLAVAPDHRGKGLGELLTKECLRRAAVALRQAQRPAGVMGLFTSERMVSAQRLYERLGFVRECEIPPRLGMRYFRYRLELKRED